MPVTDSPVEQAGALSLRALKVGALSGLVCGLLVGLWLFSAVGAAQPGAFLGLACAYGALGGAFLGGLTGLMGAAREWPTKSVMIAAGAAPAIASAALFLGNFALS
jgi:hypothetical protein